MAAGAMIRKASALLIAMAGATPIPAAGPTRHGPTFMSVIHSHSPTIIPFSISQTSLPPVFSGAAFLSPSASVFDIRQVADMTDLLIGNGELGKALGVTLGQDVVTRQESKFSGFDPYQTSIAFSRARRRRRARRAAGARRTGPDCARARARAAR